MMIKWTYEDKQLFSNLQKIEKEFIKANEAIASGTGDLKEQISGLFDTLRDVSKYFFHSETVLLSEIFYTKANFLIFIHF